MHSDPHAILASVIETRKTEKILRDLDTSPPISNGIQQYLAACIQEDLLTAGWDT